jgi:S-adenosylmethionine/arginine decarboxylase-like enzyme
MSLFHQHLLVKALVSSPPRSEEALNAWLNALVAAINMNVCIAPRSFYVDTPGNEGLTGQIGLSTSHCAIHVWDHVIPALVQLDVYSCKEYEAQTVVNMLRNWGLISWELMEIDRNDTFKITKHETGTVYIHED